MYNPEKKSFSGKEKFEIMAGAILTQNTAWNNVEIALSNLRKANLIDIEKISKINLKILQKYIKPSGFYKQKARRLKNFASFLYFRTNVRKCSKPNKCSVSVRFDKITREELLSLNGIGPETADSILLYALEKPYFVVDTYTKRLINRLGIFNSENYEDIQRFFEENIPRDVDIYKEYHALIVTLAKKICKKKPECGRCPIMKDCRYGMSKMWKKN